MASTPSIVSTSSLDAAAGQNIALRNLLQPLTTAANAQASKTNTSGKNAPNQSNATVLFQNPLYLVNFIESEVDAPGSLTQQAQQAALASLGSNPTRHPFCLSFKPILPAPQLSA
jgi:hypothetical protein